MSAGRRDASTPLIATLKDDVRTVAGDMRRRGVRREVGGTLSGLEEFYLTDDDRKRLASMPRVRRWLHRIWWLVKCLLLRLTPARRVMLALALLMLVLGSVQIQFQAYAFSFRFPLAAYGLLLAVLMLELKDKLTARDELEAGRVVQLAFLPDERPEVPGWDVWLHSSPANDVGGDLIDHMRVDDLRYGLALGDVAGKALPAALLMVKLQATLRALAPQFDDLGALGGGLNRILERDGVPSRFASLVYVVVTTGSGDVRVLNAGHMPPLVARGRRVETLPQGSVVLGIMPDAVFPEQRVELGPGDVMVVYSDGVSEAMNEAGQFFDDARVKAVVEQSSGLPVDALGARILAAVRAFTGDVPQHDDVSLLILRRRAA